MPLSVRVSKIPLGPKREVPNWPTNGVVINSFVDFILENVRTCPSLERYKLVPIPILAHRLEASSLSASLAGTLVASRGTLSDLRTLRRAGDLILSTQGDVLYVSGTVALDTLHAVFKRYSLQASVFRKTGDLLAVRVAENSFEVFLKIRLDKTACDVTLEEISIVRFRDVTVDMTGFSMLNQLSCRVVEWIIQSFSSLVKDIVEAYAKRLVNGVFTDPQLVSRLLGCGMMGMAGRGGVEEEGQEGEEVQSAVCLTNHPDNVDDMSVTIVVSPCHRKRVKIV